jgi:hypothetical protein
VLLLLLILADVSAPLPHRDWAQDCEARLRSAAHGWSRTDAWFDLWWKFRVRKDAIEVRYTADVDICGVYDDFKIRVSRDGGKIQKLHDDGGDFAEFKRRFQPVIDSCLRKEDQEDGGEEGGPVAQHEPTYRTSRATH